MKNVQIELFKGDEAEKYIPDIAKLRITVFREFPYLYDGDLEYEKNYLAKFVQFPPILNH